jgi:hypothetical protein
MVDLLEISACSGTEWNPNLVNNYILDSQTLAQYFNRPDLNIKNVEHVDGISDWPTRISPNLNYYYGSGSIIIETRDIGTFVTTVNPRLDSNIKNSHKPDGIHLNINLPVIWKKPDGTTEFKEIEEIKRYSIHGISSKKGMLKLKDLYNNEQNPFSEHTLKIKSNSIFQKIKDIIRKFILKH